MSEISIGYTGSRRSVLTGEYLLGNGYRGFNPVLKRFATQDSLSPFGVGGEHGFAYCGGNPINRSDPSGHGPLIDFIIAATVGLRNIRRAGTGDAVADAIGNAMSDISNAAVKAGLDVSFDERGLVTGINITGKNEYVTPVGIKAIMNDAPDIIKDILEDGEHHIRILARHLNHHYLDTELDMFKEGVNTERNAFGARVSRPFLGRVDYIRNGEGIIEGLRVRSGHASWVTNINEVAATSRSEAFLNEIISNYSIPHYSEYFYGGTPQGEMPPAYDSIQNDISNVRR